MDDAVLLFVAGDMVAGVGAGIYSSGVVGKVGVEMKVELEVKTEIEGLIYLNPCGRAVALKILNVSLKK